MLLNIYPIYWIGRCASFHSYRRGFALKRRSLPLILGFLFCLGGILRCAPTVCVPGSTQECSCPDSKKGAQSCIGGGTSWGSCSCPSETVKPGTCTKKKDGEECSFSSDCCSGVCTSPFGEFTMKCVACSKKESGESCSLSLDCCSNDCDFHLGTCK